MKLASNHVIPYVYINQSCSLFSMWYLSPFQRAPYTPKDLARFCSQNNGALTGPSMYNRYHFQDRLEHLLALFFVCVCQRLFDLISRSEIFTNTHHTTTKNNSKINENIIQRRQNDDEAGTKVH